MLCKLIKKSLVAFSVFVGARGFEPPTLALVAPRSNRAEYSGLANTWQFPAL